MNEQIVRQLNGGLYENKYLDYSTKSKPTLVSKRTNQVLNAVIFGNKVQKPNVSQKNLQEVKNTSLIRQMRYFGAWCLDQWDYAEKHLYKQGYKKSTVKKIKDEFIDALHGEFTSGVAYEYADDWYQAFPNGGHFNPMRYGKLYADEKEIAHLVSEYIQCNHVHPAIASLMSHPKPSNFNHTFVKNGGSVTLNYPTESNIRDVLAADIESLDDSVAHMIGEHEDYKKDNKIDRRVFITKSIEYADGRSTCAVLFDQFDSVEKNYLASCMRAAIMEHIPPDSWRSYTINVALDANRVTQGEMDMARMYLKDKPKTKTYDVKKSKDEEFDAELDESLLSIIDELEKMQGTQFN